MKIRDALLWHARILGIFANSCEGIGAKWGAERRLAGFRLDGMPNSLMFRARFRPAKARALQADFVGSASLIDQIHR